MGAIISDDPALLNIPMIHRFLSEESTWATGIPLATVERAISNSLCFGAYEEAQQVGFVRIVTDWATFGYLCDLFVIPTHRRRGIARQLIEAVLAHSDLSKLRRFTLVSSNAGNLYEKFGWTPLHEPESYMERYFPHIYQQS